MADTYANITEEMEKKSIRDYLNKRSKVIEAITTLEKNKIQASNDNIMLQLGDVGLCRKEVLEIISQLYTTGYINKSKGNFRVSKAGKTKPSESAAETTVSATLPSAGVTISHDGLPTISSVHSYQSGKTMTYPVGMVKKDENTIHHHPSQLQPRYSHPHPNMVYHPAMAPPFIHPSQMVPIHVPYEHVIGDSERITSNTYPVAYYPVLTSPDGKHVQWMFYPMSIPVNAVRPMVSDKAPKKECVSANKHTKDEVSDPPSVTKLKSPGSITSDMIENLPNIDNDRTSVANSASVNHPRHSLQRTDKLKYQDVAEDFNKASSLLKNQGPSGSVRNTRNDNSNIPNYSPPKNKLTEEMNTLFAMQPREAVLAKKRKQLLGIVDRVTEVAESKQKRLNLNENCTLVQAPGETSSVDTMKDSRDLIDTYIDEIAMESAKLRDKQKMEKEKPCQRASDQPRLSLMSKIKYRLDDILKRTEGEKEQKLKEFSSCDTVRDILRSPPEFIADVSNVSSIGEFSETPASGDVTQTNFTDIIDSPIGVHPRRILYDHEPAPSILPNTSVVNVDDSLLSSNLYTVYHQPHPKMSDYDSKISDVAKSKVDFGSTCDANQRKTFESEVDDIRKDGHNGGSVVGQEVEEDSSTEEPLFNPIDFDNWRNLNHFNPNIVVRDVRQVDKYKKILPSSDVTADDEDVKKYEVTTISDDESDSVLEIIKDSGQDPSIETPEPIQENPPGAVKEYLTRLKKLRLQLDEFKEHKKESGIDESKNKDASVRTKRSRTEVYYKESRTNFMKSYQ